MTQTTDPARPGASAAEDRGIFAEWMPAVQQVAERFTDVLDPADLARAVRSELRHGLGASAIVLATASEGSKGFHTVVLDGVSDETRAWLSRSEPDPTWAQTVSAVAAHQPLLLVVPGPAGRGEPRVRRSPIARQFVGHPPPRRTRRPDRGAVHRVARGALVQRDRENHPAGGRPSLRGGARPEPAGGDPPG